MEPIVFVGQKGFGEQLVLATEQALFDHELIKVKFVEHKDEKKELAQKIAEQTNSTVVGMIGNIAMLYKENPEKKKNKIVV